MQPRRKRTPGVRTIDRDEALPADRPPVDLDARRAVDAVLAGDREAFRLLVDQESSSVLRTCHRVLGNLHDAEDAAQESFVIAFRSLAGWRGDGSFGAWLGRIAVRTAVRRAKSRRTVVRIDPGDPEGPGGRGSAGSAAGADRASSAAPFLSASGAHDPVQLTLQSERSDELRRAILLLDEPYRETVMLRFFGELSLAEIAAETGRPLGTVKTHLFRGLGRLRAVLATEASIR